MNKYYYIYKITFLKGSLKGKYYIGKKVGHKSDMINDGYFGSGHMTYNYYKKYPPVIGETITKEILEVCDGKEELAECEKKWIGDLWETDENCVNLKRGGEGGWGPSYWKGKHRSEETKKKLSEANKGKKGRKHTDETKHKLSEVNTGKHRSEEAKRKMSEAHKGKSSGMKGKKMSEETKKKLSEVNTGKHLSDEVKSRISKKLKGIKRSDETKRKLSELHKSKKVGFIWINNGIQSKLLNPELIEQYLSEGWQLGRIKKAAKQAA